MSEKHAFKFQTENDYKTAKNNHLIVPNISVIVESGNTYINTPFVSKSSAEAGDIIVYHEENGVKSVKIMKPEVFEENNGYWTAEAIVVVPASHTDDGTVRAMALTEFDAMFGKDTAINLDRVDRPNALLTFSSIQGQTAEYTYGISAEIGNMPSDVYASSYVQNPFDMETYYKENFNNGVVSSPYNNDGTRNEAYHSLGDFSSFDENPLKFMDGAKNTFGILTYLDQNHLADTLYANEITNAQTKTVGGETLNLFPAAMMCARYSSALKPCSYDSNKSVSDNIATMPWYLPTLGEMGYLVARLNRINYALAKIGNTPIGTDVDYVTSILPKYGSEDYGTAYRINTNGRIMQTFPDVTRKARPFCKY